MYNSMKLPNSKTISIPVVQELAARDPDSVPQRYRREEERLHSITVSDNLSSSIPIIDLSLLSEHKESRQQVMEKLSLACQEWGFFQVVNHGVPVSVLDQMKQVVRDFFQLPLEEKLKCGIQEREGYGQAFVISDEQKLDWSDMLYLVTLPEDVRNMNFWPRRPTNFRETMNDFGMEIQKLSNKLLSLIAETLGLKINSFINPEGKWIQGARMNYYPRCSRPDLVFGIGPHSDPSNITILLQDDEQVGLHIRKDGEWIPVEPISGALVVNIGDMVEV
ncbi:oxoglutarate-dependent flavonoid 7-O-demethylase 1 isoform X2 [Cryptomeria japonica]|nr:oxoglutarate-dependent flavonoid 7-O-demethylase 1 isoform X2 [Cryptomeria japonica]